MWKRAALYGTLLAAGTFALQWLDYRALAWAHSGNIYLFLLASAFLALGAVRTPSNATATRISAVTHMDFAGDYARQLIEQQRAAGVSGEALAKFTAEMERFKTQDASPLYRLPMTFAEIFPVGILVSLISAALLRNSRFWPAQRARAGSNEPARP